MCSEEQLSLGMLSDEEVEDAMAGIAWELNLCQFVLFQFSANSLPIANYSINRILLPSKWSKEATEEMWDKEGRKAGRVNFK